MWSIYSLPLGTPTSTSTWHRCATVLKRVWLLCRVVSCCVVLCCVVTKHVMGYYSYVRTVRTYGMDVQSRVEVYRIIII